MQDAFLAAVLARMAVTGIPGSWSTLLRSLKFDTANWYFKPWVVGLDGNAGGQSKKLAQAILSEAFIAGRLRPGVTDIPSQLKGDGATLELEFKQIINSRAARGQGTCMIFPVSRHGVQALQGAHDFRMTLVDSSPSIGRIVAWDMDAQRKTFTKSTLGGAGVMLSRPANDTREIHFRVEYYGGVEEIFKLTVNW